MVKAKVSIESVNQFAWSVEKQYETTKTSTQNTNNQIEQIQTDLQQEQNKAHQQKESLQVALDTIQNKILAQQEIVAQLESELSSLLASEPEEFETVWIPGETDDEGNVISEGYWDEVETSEHIAWCNEVSAIEIQLNEEQDKLNHYHSLESRAQTVLSEIQKQINLIQSIQDKLLSVQEALSQLLHKAEDQSRQCVEKLQQIQRIVQEYLDKKIPQPTISNGTYHISTGKSNGTASIIDPLDDVLWGRWEDYEHVTINNNQYAIVGDYYFSEHAIARTQPSGQRGRGQGRLNYITNHEKLDGRSISPAYVIDAVKRGDVSTEFEKGEVRHIHKLGSIKVVTSEDDKVIITLMDTH